MTRKLNTTEITPAPARGEKRMSERKTSDEKAKPALVASTKEVRRIFKERGASAICGWLGFKHCLMDELGIPRSQSFSWDVPADWQQAYKEACGRG